MASAAALEATARAYFSARNSHDSAAVGALFAPQGTLRDWDIEVHGSAAVAAANAKIFTAVPKIHIEVLSIHACEASHSAACEILVNVHDEAGTVLKVCDIISWTPDGSQILAVRAYKG